MNAKDIIKAYDALVGRAVKIVGLPPYIAHVFPGFSYGELMAIKLPSGEWGYAKRKDLVYRVKDGRRVPG